MSLSKQMILSYYMQYVLFTYFTHSLILHIILRAIKVVRKLSNYPLSFAYDPHVWAKTVSSLRKMKNVFKVGLVLH